MAEKNDFAYYHHPEGNLIVNRVYLGVPFDFEKSCAEKCDELENLLIDSPIPA